MISYKNVKSEIDKTAIMRRKKIDWFITSFFLVFSITSVIIFAGILLYVIREALPALLRPNILIELFTSDRWSTSNSFQDPTAHYGAIGIIYSSLYISFLSLIISLPFGVGGAIFLVYYAPNRMRQILRPLLEITAAIPSVVMGLFAITFMTVFIRDLFHLSSGRVVLTAAIILAVMVTPFITSLAIDALENTPKSLTDAALSMGSTKWEAIRNVVLPYSKSGIIAGIILAYARAFGETMVVLMVGGNSPSLPDRLFDPFAAFYAMPAVIALEIQNAVFGAAEYHILFAIGLILLIMSFVTMTFARFINKSQKTAQIVAFFVLFPIFVPYRLLQWAKLFYIAKTAPKSGNSINWKKNGRTLAQRMRKSIKTRRSFDTLIQLAFGMAIAIFIGITALILTYVFYNGWTAVTNPNFLLKGRTSHFDYTQLKLVTDYGILPAIIGSFIVVTVAMVFSIIISTVTAVYLAEIAPKESKIRAWIQNSLASLASVPSIVVGLFGYGLFVLTFGWGLSVLSGAATLTIMMLPITITAATEALEQVPKDLRDASIALGATRWETIRYQVLPNAIPGLITSYIFGIARVFGETAPILLTVAVDVSSMFPTSLFNEGVNMLPYVVYVQSRFNTDPRAELWAFGAATVLLVLALVLMLVGTILREKYRKTFS